jgi:iron(III) transport system permease protein
MSTLSLQGALSSLAKIDHQVMLKRLLIVLLLLWLAVVVILPVFQLLSKSLINEQGEFVGLANYIYYFNTPALSSSLRNSIFVSFVTTAISMSLGFFFAYGLTRTCIRGKGVLKSLAMMPLFAPTLLNGISLVYLFGNKGLITRGFFGAVPGLAIELYGPIGIIISEVMFTFPQAMLILTVSLAVTDARLYEASESLGASKLRTFVTVTLYNIRYGLISAFFVCFVLAFTDFGAPKVVGGNYNILATDIYKQVVGQQNFIMGAVVSVVLLIPTAAAFVIDRLAQRKQSAIISAKSVVLTPKPSRPRDTFFMVFTLAVVLLIVAFYSTALYASLVKVWPYKLELGFWHYDFDRVGGGGYAAFFNSIKMSAITAVIGTVLIFSSAYLIEKSRGMAALRQVSYFMSVLPLALPGLVIGIAYIFFFNAPGWSILGLYVPNPLTWVYGTMVILVLSNVVHFYTVSFLTATTALKQLDKEFEVVSESMGVPFYVTFIRVSVPVCLPAILEIAMYLFVNSMATVSAVIFLYSADIPLASVAIANMDDAGDIAPACAMAVLVVATNILVRFGFGLVTRGVKKKYMAWTAH